MEKEALVSLIVTAYNQEHYLRECLDSVIRQTYCNLEVILVDDGSTDDSELICDEYAKRDSRMTVIHLNNSGVSNARNQGIDASHGDYLMFLDGDDLISPRLVETLVAIHSGEEDTISCCDALEFHDGEEVAYSDTDAINVHNFENATFIRSMYILPREIAYPSTVWGKLYPRELVGDIRFRNIISEDNVFNTEVIINRCRAIQYTDAQLYGYRRHRQSMMAQLDKIGKKYVDRCYTLYYINEHILPKDNSYARGLNLWYLHYRLLHSRYIVKQHCTENCEEYRYAQQVVKDLRKKTLKEFLANKYVPLDKKITYPLYETFPKLYSLKLFIDYYLFHKWS